MAIVTDSRTGARKFIGQWHAWVRYHKGDIVTRGLVEVVEQADGGAEVRIEAPYTESDTLTLVDYWGSYQVARNYFGDVKGWQGSRMLRSARKRFVNRHGEIELDTTGAVDVEVK